MSVLLYVVVPCYNEEAVLIETNARLTAKLARLIALGAVSADSRIMYVDDGSHDATWAMICDMHAENPAVTGLKLSRNRGHQYALVAGLDRARNACDVCISMDADLQDDIEAIDVFLTQYHAGCDVVYGVRGDRAADTWFKKTSAQAFYKLMKLLGADVVYNHADYRLMSKRALQALSEFKEVNLFLRGVVPLVGYKSGTVTYTRHERFAGETKYPLKRMLALAFEGVTSLSVKPIRMITALGIAIFAVSVIMAIYFIITHFWGGTVAGWTSLIASVWAIGGLQLLAIGVVGEYIGKIYMETKARPRYIIEEDLE